MVCVELLVSCETCGAPLSARVDRTASKSLGDPCIYVRPCPPCSKEAASNDIAKGDDRYSDGYTEGFSAGICSVPE